MEGSGKFAKGKEGRAAADLQASAVSIWKCVFPQFYVFIFSRWVPKVTSGCFGNNNKHFGDATEL